MRSRTNRKLLPCALALAFSTWAQAAPVDPEALREVEGLRANKAWLDALQVIEREYARDPASGEWSRLRTLTLADAGSFVQANREAEKHPELYSESELNRIKLGALARETAWSKFTFPVEAADLDRAKTADQHYTEWTAAHPKLVPEDQRTLDSDRLILAARLRQYPDVVARYEAMQARGETVAPYALLSVGEAYRAVRKPKGAVAAYDAALKAYPNDPTIEVERGYALSESEQIDPAVNYLWHIRENNPAWIVLPTSKTPAENPPHMEAEVAYYMVRSFGNDLKGAQAGYESMVSFAPANPQLQEAVGSVYLRRGWPTRALERFQIAETLDPAYVDARIGQVSAYMALNRYDLARPINDRLVAVYSGNQHVTQLQETWRNNTGWQLKAWTAIGRSNNHTASLSTPYGSRDSVYGIEVASPLLNDRWRVFAYHAQNSGTFDNETLRDRWLGAGVRYVFGRLSWAGTVSRPLTFERKTALDFDLGYEFTDSWQGYTHLAHNDRDIPIQAREFNIHADSATIGTVLTPSELSRWAAEVGKMRFSDGNRRTLYNTSYIHRLVTQSHFLMDGRIRAEGSRNRGTVNAPYYNPEADGVVALGLRLDHLAWRQYTDSFRHVLDIDVGRYWQKGYGSGIVPTVRYSHEWRFSKGWGIDYGISWSRPLYDGNREQRVAFDATLVIGAW